MINRRQLLAGFLATAVSPMVLPGRIGRDTIGQTYLAFDDIPLESFGHNQFLLPPVALREMTERWDRIIGYAMHDAAKGESLQIRIGQ